MGCKIECLNGMVVLDEVYGWEEKSEWVAAKNLGKDELVNGSRC